MIDESRGPLAQGLDFVRGQALGLHVVQGGRVDHVVYFWAAQQFQEVGAAFRGGALEAGKALIAQMGAVTVLAPVAGAGIIHVKIGAGGEARGQQVGLLGVERPAAFDDQSIQLTAGNIDTPFP